MEAQDLAEAQDLIEAQADNDRLVMSCDLRVGFDEPGRGGTSILLHAEPVDECQQVSDAWLVSAKVVGELWLDSGVD